MKESIAIAGGGLVGTILAAYLARQYDVTVYEWRGDIRQQSGSAGRSINLIMTSRGLNALEGLGLGEAARNIAVPVFGRMMHPQERGQQLSYQPYGLDPSECNFSVSRGDLNKLLLDQAEKAGAKLAFNSRIEAVDFQNKTLTTVKKVGGTEEFQTLSVDHLLGADGAGSAVRRLMSDQPGFQSSVEPLGSSYKELNIPAEVAKKYNLDLKALHIWPRKSIMLMALPNVDSSFTLTLYMPDKGEVSFDSVRTNEEVQDLFDTYFYDALPLIPNLYEDFAANPVGQLATVRCKPWNVGGFSTLVGDAAHAIVPFFGQGMNCGFEDCTVLMQLLNNHQDWTEVLDKFSELRKPNADAIATMALENFVEMSDLVGEPSFLLRKKVEHKIESTWPKEYRSRYALVAYKLTPYAKVFEVGKMQSLVLDELCDGLENVDDLDMNKAHKLIKDKLGSVYKELDQQA